MSEILVTTWAAYCIYFTQGFFFVLPGALTPIFSEYFGYSLSTVGYCFTLMTLARTVGNFCTGRMFLKLKLHAFVIKTTLAISVLLLVAVFADNLILFTVAAVLASVCLGAHFAISNNLILYLYVGKKRTAQMSFLNFFYSAGAIVSPFILSFFLINGVHWSWIIIAAALLTLTALLCTKSDEGMFFDNSGAESAQELVLNPHIYLSAAGAMLNVTAEMMFSVWLPVFLMERLGLPLAEAAFSLVMLWLGFAIGRFSCGFLANYLRNYKIIFLLATLVFSGVTLLFTIGNTDNYKFIILLIGLGMSGMFSNLLAYGNEQTPKPNVKLMTILTTLGSAGGILGLFISSFMKSFAQADIIILSAYVASCISTACVVLSVWLKNREGRRNKYA